VSVDSPLRLALVLAFAALLAALYAAVARRTGAAALAYSNLAFMRAALRPRRLPGIVVAACWCAAAVALALAAGGTRVFARVPSPDGAVVICVDTSGSMASSDIAPTREEAARNAIRTFVASSPPGVKIGIVAFSTNANVISPLTDDRDQLAEAIDRIPEANGATAIGDALTAANQLLPNKGHRFVVLLTDGVNNRGSDPLEAAQTLASRGIPIDAVGIGTNESGVVIPGTEEEASIDEDALRAIAASGGGRYVRVSDARSLHDVFTKIAEGTVWERRRVDASLPLAFGGALALVVAFFTGFAAGKFP
jgi:Ca-activated chloride channel family protein